MIELRWLIRLKDDGNTEKVLQMRQEYDTTVRAGNFIPGQPFCTPERTKITWSPWLDVPTFLEEPNYQTMDNKYARN